MKQKVNGLNVIKYAGAYIAFIIGSGFATGQEIIQFYTSYGIWGIGSIAISMFLFAWVGGTVTDMGFRTKGMEKVNAYGQICGKWLGTFYEYFVRIFLFAVVVVMISGAGATLNEYYGLNYYVGSLLMAVLIFVAFAFGFNKLLDVIGCIGPVIIVFSIVVAVATIVSGSGLDLNVDITPIANMRSSANWWISGILYASYNIFGAIPFLTTMGAGSTSAREVKLGGILGGVVLMTAVLFMNTIFSRTGAAVVGICPQFTDYVLSARCHGFDYRPVYLKQEENFQLMPERVVAAIDDAVSLVYLDNPNNPTGQSVPLDAMRMILDKAREVGACVISDEAYGDYLAPEDSAITLVNEYDNLIVMRSFSKGTGLAGMRAAYVAASPEIIAQIDKVSNPYCINGIGRRLAVAALEDTAFVEESRRRIAAAKQALRSCTGGALSMAATLDSCSICLLTHKDKNCDLAKLFASYGVKVVSGSDFEGLGTNSVRLRLPPQEQEKALLCIVRDIDRGASDRVS